MKYLQFMIALVLIGCVDREQAIKNRVEDDRNNALRMMQNVIYIKEPSTQLCFMTIDPTWNNAMLTNVPCTDAVEKNLINK
jgi:hypothetical protein